MLMDAIREYRGQSIRLTAVSECKNGRFMYTYKWTIKTLNQSGEGFRTHQEAEANAHVYVDQLLESKAG